MAHSLKHFTKLASPKALSSFYLSSNEVISPVSRSITRAQHTPEKLTDEYALRLANACRSATKASFGEKHRSSTRSAVVRKLDWGSEFTTSPKKNSHNFCYGLSNHDKDSEDKLVLLDTPVKIALSSKGLNSRKQWMKLGKGSFGTVVRGKYKGEDVAVKVVPKKRFSKALASLKNESNAMKLSHKNVVRILQVTATEGDYGLVFMEMCHGFNLQSLLSDPKHIINGVRRTRYAMDIASALRHCHSRKILHLDVKPSNIIVCSPGDYCKLCDFGSSHIYENDKYDTSSPSMTTVIYSAPSLLQGKLPSEKSDIYSFGITCWQMMSRENPYEGNTLHSIIYMVGSGKLRPRKVESIKTEDRDYVSLYTQCWHQNPNKRPSTRIILQELQRILTAINAFS
ncbi:serine/threonine-protein kinase mos-like [Periplaneta americana]|uniref:serine/threonine-protein kinase mos-like n=1 Tax=Periplaneta americana TaxID=6978 RepID=UPI0037E92D87